MVNRLFNLHRRLPIGGAWRFVDRTGARGIGTVRYILDVMQMVYLSIRAAVFDQSQGLRTIFGVVSAQIYFTGFQALPLVTLLALASGSIVILQSAAQLSLLGGQAMLGNLMVVVIVREVGPLVTALIVIARSGTAVASEIGNMRAGREIEALEVMGIDPLSYIVFPRIVGGVVSVLCLAFYFNAVALLGGFFAARFINGMALSFFTESLANAVTAEDVGLFLLKNGFSGVIIFVVSCYQGLLVKESSHEVPQVTTRAVLNSVIFVVTFNLAVTTLFYLNQLMKLGVI